MRLLPQLDLSKCPHCNVDSPSLGMRQAFKTTTHSGGNQRQWKTYACARCGGVVLAASEKDNGTVREVYPSPFGVDESIPSPAREYLVQAIDTIHAPAGSVMLSASAVDAMLKEKLYIEGSLYSRIEKASEDHVITSDMATWAHEVRLDANDQRHADVDADLPQAEDAKRSSEFALALAELLFVLPSRVNRGIETAVENTSEESEEQLEDAS